MSTHPSQSFDKLEEALGYKFKDGHLLKRALTHRSYVNEATDKVPDNQRLEFLGDAVLSLIIATGLFYKHPTLTEGPLSAARAGLVNDRLIAGIADEISLGDYMELGQGEKNSGGRKKTSILADAFEAIVGAIYLDGGLEEARRVILSIYGSRLDNITQDNLSPKDYKSKFQRIVQRQEHQFPTYEIIEREGPPHRPTFRVKVLVRGKVIATGTGSSIKAAEHNAAFNAIKELENHGNRFDAFLDD